MLEGYRENIGGKHKHWRDESNSPGLLVAAEEGQSELVPCATGGGVGGWPWGRRDGRGELQSTVVGGRRRRKGAPVQRN